jgi:hypothetical protein
MAWDALPVRRSDSRLIFCQVDGLGASTHWKGKTVRKSD